MGAEIEFKFEKNPTMQQIQYLIELEKIQGGRGMIARIAENCNVNAASVSRFLKSCYETGVLTKEYTLTEAGKVCVDSYKTMIQELYAYFRQIGIRETLLDANVKNMVENVDAYTITSMLAYHHKLSSFSASEKGLSSARRFLLENFPKRLECEVYFTLFAMQANKINVSSADAAFLKPARIKHNRRGSWLFLQLAEMEIHSRISGEKMTGYIENLKYCKEGIWFRTDIKDKKIRLPLDAFQFQMRAGGEIRGSLPLQMTYTAGRVHMPENTAVLMVWL